MIYAETKKKRKELSLPKLLAKAQYNYFIGIDPGVNTGYAFWDAINKEFIYVETYPIHTVMNCCKTYDERSNNKLFVRIEDARKRKWFGDAGREQLQGAGSIKRDCKIWEDFLTDLKIPFEMVAPKKKMTKINAEAFKKITGWKGRTSEHARDAAMLVYGL